MVPTGPAYMAGPPPMGMQTPRPAFVPHNAYMVGPPAATGYAASKGLTSSREFSFLYRNVLWVKVTGNLLQYQHHYKHYKH